MQKAACAAVSSLIRDVQQDYSGALAWDQTAWPANTEAQLLMVTRLIEKPLDLRSPVSRVDKSTDFKGRDCTE